ncbi:hypothetical protein HAX54_036167, partial [Datura stramonium]|nr:hypothetical protein [Datura stramonium]
ASGHVKRRPFFKHPDGILEVVGALWRVCVTRRSYLDSYEEDGDLENTWRQ